MSPDTSLEAGGGTLPPELVFRHPTTREQLWRRIEFLVYPLITVTMIIIGWQLAIAVFDIKRFLLPPPADVLDSLINDRAILLRNTWPTLKEITLGYGLAIAVGIPLAVTIVASRVFEKMVYPILVVTQTVPKIAIAPLLLVWFGFGQMPKILIAFLISFFPIVIDTAVGLRSVPTEMIDLARSMGGSRLSIFRKVRFPYALPNVFGGLKVGVTLAVIGAVVGEFVGSQAGLGYLVLISQGRIDTSLLFATIVVLALLGIVAFLVVDVAERVAIPWHTSQRREGSEALQDVALETLS